MSALFFFFLNKERENGLGWFGILEDDFVGGLDDVVILLRSDVVLEQDGVVLREVVLVGVAETSALQRRREGKKKKESGKSERGGEGWR